MVSILIVDDEKAIRDTIRTILVEEGYKVKTAENIYAAKQKLESEAFHIVLLDIWLPDGNGLAFLKEIKNSFPDINVIIITGHGKIEDAVKAIKMGAFDFIEKPFSIKKLLSCVAQAVQETPQQKETKKKIIDQIVGESEAIKDIKELIKKFAKTDASILITGESGTGKDLVAYTIHQLSPRKNGPFVDINCASIREDLIETELYGYGNDITLHYTKKGKIEMADGGSLFLDAVDEANLKLQTSLLRVIETKSFTKLGSNATVESDFRLISASVKKLEEIKKENRLRSDFLYRISTLHIHIPPLRERKEDILPLVEYYTNAFCSEYQKTPMLYSDDAIQILIDYPWHGNVRELKNFIQRLVILYDKEYIGSQDIKALLPQWKQLPLEHFQELNIKKAKQEFEKRFILEKLKEYNYDLKKVSEAIGLDLSNLYRKMKQYGIGNKD